MNRLQLNLVTLLACLPLLMVAGAPARAQPEARFELEAAAPRYRVGGPIVLAWRLTNQAARPRLVLAGMETPGRMDFDPITLTLTRLDGAAPGKGTVVGLMGKRSATRIVMQELAPGDSLTRSFDLVDFLPLYGVRLEPGAYRVEAEYDLGRAGILSDEQRPRALLQRVVAAPVTISVRP